MITEMTASKRQQKATKSEFQPLVKDDLPGWTKTKIQDSNSDALLSEALHKEALHDDQAVHDDQTLLNDTHKSIPPTISPIQLLLLSIMVLQNVCVVLLARYTQTLPSQIPYNSSHLVMLSETMKLFACVLLAAIENLNHLYPSPSFLPDLPPLKLLSSIPLEAINVVLTLISAPLNSLVVLPVAILYLLQNNILYLALRNLSAPVFQVCYQTKLVTTAILSVLMIENRSYSRTQWICLTSLYLGVAIAVISGSSSEPSNPNNNLILGVGCCMVATLSSGLAGVYFEKVVKGGVAVQANPPSSPPLNKLTQHKSLNRNSLWVRNIELAGLSLFVGLAWTALRSLSSPPSSSDVVPPLPYLSGFTGTVWCLTLLQAFGGLVVACIVKYADNVLKGLATGVSLVVGTVVSSVVMGTRVEGGFVGGSAIILGR